MEVITGPELARLVGLQRRQVAYLARQGAIPGAFRPYGNQFRFTVTSELENWIEWKCLQVSRSRQSLPSENRKMNVGVIAIHGLRDDFERWRRRMEPVIPELKSDDIHEILVQLSGLADFYGRLKSIEEAHKNADSSSGAGLPTAEDRLHGG